MDGRRALNGPPARAVRLAGAGFVTVTAAIGGAYLVLPLAVGLFVRGLTATLNGCIWVAASFSSGADTWTIVTTIGRAAAGALATPQAFGAIALLVVVSALALAGLQRLLGSEEDSSQ
jgi:hypothetical protein